MHPTAANSAPARDCDTRWLLCLAALLIANSHLERYYPVSWLAADGLLGNSIFFFLSGFGVVRSLNRDARSFPAYYLRRVLRIYPAVILAETVWCLITGGVQNWSAREWLGQFLWPTHYAFIAQVMVFYVLLYFLARSRSRKVFEVVLGGLLLVFAWLYGRDLAAGGMATLTLGTRSPWLWHVLFLTLMVYGGWSALPTERAPRPMRWWLLPLLFVAYVIGKLAMVKGWVIPRLGISSANGYALLFVFVALMIGQLLALARDGRVAAWLARIPLVGALVAFIGGVTLEIYLFHGFVQEVDAIRSLPFPLNVAVFFVATLLVSGIVSQAVRWFRQRLARVVPAAGTRD